MGGMPVFFVCAACSGLWILCLLASWIPYRVRSCPGSHLVSVQVPEPAKHALSVISKIKAEYFRTNNDCVVGSGGKSVG